MTDALALALAAVRSHAEQTKTPIISGTIEADMVLPRIEYEPEPIGDMDPSQGDRMKGYLVALGAFATQALIVSITRVDEIDWEEAQAAWAAAEGELGEQYAGIVAHAKEVLAAAENPVGEIAELTVAAVTQHPPLLITFTERAPWHLMVMSHQDMLARYRKNVAENAGDGGEERIARQEAWRRMEEESRAREAEHREWTGAKRKDVVSQLAQHPDFPRCKKEEARIFLFSRIVGDDAMPRDRELARIITREALAMYEIEIKPKK
ncbi:MAG: hypothetical protein ACR2M1_07640 [Gemmatimonadaceae bacterium]